LRLLAELLKAIDRLAFVQVNSIDSTLDEDLEDKFAQTERGSLVPEFEIVQEIGLAKPARMCRKWPVALFDGKILLTALDFLAECWETAGTNKTKEHPQLILHIYGRKWAITNKADATYI
jgi:hypothetical protein